MGEAKKLFLEECWPILASACGGGSIVNVEGLPNPAATALDFSGVDWIQICDGHGIKRDMGVRVQWGRSAFDDDGNPWATFTLRESRSSGAETEISKLKRAQEAGQLDSTRLFAQCYCSHRGKFVIGAVAPVLYVLRAINQFGWQAPESRDPDGSWSRFRCVHFSQLALQRWPVSILDHRMFLPQKKSAGDEKTLF